MHAALTLLFATVAAAAAAPEAPTGPGLSASIRAAYGIPLGMAANETGGELSTLYSGAVPLSGSLGWRFDERLLAAAYFQWGYGVIGSGARAAFDTVTGSDVHAGIEASYSFAPELVFAPWVGAGIGYEWANLSGKTNASLGTPLELSTQLRGFGLLLQAGANWRHGAWPAVGPFAALTVGQFQSMQSSISGLTATRDLPNRAWHAWLQLGLRGELELPISVGR